MANIIIINKKTAQVKKVGVPYAFPGWLGVVYHKNGTVTLYDSEAPPSKLGGIF